MTIKEWIRDNANRFSTTSEMYTACVLETGSARKSCINAYAEMNPRPVLGLQTIQADAVIPKDEAIPLPGHDATEFTFIDELQLMEKHNAFYIFEMFLKSIPRGKYARETDVLRHLNMSGKPGYRQVIDHPDYKIYKGAADGIVYYGHPESIEKMKQKTTLK